MSRRFLLDRARRGAATRGTTSHLAGRFASLLVGLVAALAAGTEPLLTAQETPPTPPESVPPKEAPPTPEPPAAAPARETPQIDWLASWPEALRRARAEKKPIFVAFNADGTVDDDALAKLYREEALATKLSAFVCVVGSAAQHVETTDEAEGRHCERFGLISCADHQGCAQKAAAELFGGGEMVTPQHVVCTGEGRVLARRAFALKLPDLQLLLDRALRAAAAPPPGSPEAKAEAARVAELLADTQKARSSRKDEFLKTIHDLGSEAARAQLFDYAKKGDDDATRVAVIESLALSGDYTVVEPLLTLCKEGKKFVALAAVDALRKVALPDAKEPLKKLLPSFTGNDAGRVLRALAACGPRDPAIRELLVKKARGNDQNIRGHALIGMGSLQSAPEIETLLDKALNDRLTVARACAVYAVGRGRHEKCRDTLAKLAGAETHVALKELAETALTHLDHDPADPKCCDLDNLLGEFIALGDTRR